ncbi:MAG: SagB/ThcOx family dehydrogenase [bacterium]
MTRPWLAAALAAGVACGQATTVKLPVPTVDGVTSVEAALAARRSVRQYDDSALTLAEVSQLLWAAYGVTRPMPGAPALRGGLRTAPSAGATYPLEVYLVTGRVQGLEAGVYRYRSETHELEPHAPGDRRAALAEAALGQAWVAEAPAALVFAAVFERATGRYGARGRERYVWIDLGHSAQNVYLQCAATGLGTVAVGAFDDTGVSRALGLPGTEAPLYIMPVGRPAAD